MVFSDYQIVKKGEWERHYMNFQYGIEFQIEVEMYLKEPLVIFGCLVDEYVVMVVVHGHDYFMECLFHPLYIY
jgi:CTP synthase (UTP-ammonia lyase)